VDSVKTRMQALKCEKKLGSSIRGTFSNMMKEEGAMRPLRGATVVIAGAGPAHALYFSCYEQVKNLLLKRTSFFPDHIGHGLAGAVATLFHDAVMTPAEAVKQRMQMCCSKHTRWSHCARQLYREEGSRAFFRAYPTQLFMNVPFQVVQFMGYEYCKKILNPNDEYDISSHLISGAFAGATAAAVTNPLDVCKTLLNTQEPQLLRELNTSRIVGMRAALSTVYKVAGISGYFKGVRARIFFQAPSTAICWCTYEAIKNFLSIQQKVANSDEKQFTTLKEIVGATGSSSSSTPSGSSSSDALGSPSHHYATSQSGASGGSNSSSAPTSSRPPPSRCSTSSCNNSSVEPQQQLQQQQRLVWERMSPLRASEAWSSSKSEAAAVLKYTDIEDKFATSIRTD